MPRVIVTTDRAERGERGEAAVLFDEQVRSVHLNTDHSAMQFIERLGWAISDAEDTEHIHVEQRVRRRRSGARPPARRRGAPARNSVRA
jgi:hypothetical protein